MARTFTPPSSDAERILEQKRSVAELPFSDDVGVPAVPEQPDLPRGSGSRPSLPPAPEPGFRITAKRIRDYEPTTGCEAVPVWTQASVTQSVAANALKHTLSGTS